MSGRRPFPPMGLGSGVAWGAAKGSRAGPVQRGEQRVALRVAHEGHHPVDQVGRSPDDLVLGDAAVGDVEHDHAVTWASVLDLARKPDGRPAGETPFGDHDLQEGHRCTGAQTARRLGRRATSTPAATNPNTMWPMRLGSAVGPKENAGMPIMSGIATSAPRTHHTTP